MRYVRRVESNIKGVTSPIDLWPKTLILGKNGSGKSAITAAVELALTGRVSDVTGRAEVAREADLLALAPGRSGKLFARVTLSDGEVASWATEGTSESATRGTHSLPQGVNKATVLPLRQVREALLGSPQTARQFFVRHVGVGSSNLIVESKFAQILLPKFLA